MKKNILKYVLLSLIIVFGFFSWFLIFYLSKMPSLNAWFFLILFFSLLIIFMCLATILISQRIIVEIIVVISFIFSLIFSPFLWYLPILLLAILLVISGLREIRKDLDLNIKIDIWKSLYMGKFKIMLALSLLISSQYFFITNNPNGQKVIPKLDFSLITSRVVEPVLTLVNPSFKSIPKGELTVDEFIIHSQQSSDKPNSFEEINNPRIQLLQKNNEMIIQEGRKQLSQMVGRVVGGDEKMSNIFAELINKKINAFFQPKINDDSNFSFYSYAVAIILFITIWPLSSILTILWFLIIIFIFKIFVYFGLVEIKKVTVQKEIII